MKKLYIILVMLIALQMHGQQDPQYTQYMYNMNVINPAYAGSKEHLSFGFLYRTQWVGIDGAPKTGTFFGHLPVSDKVGVGLSVIADQIGPVKETNAYADFSYTLRLAGEHSPRRLSEYSSRALACPRRPSRPRQNSQHAEYSGVLTKPRAPTIGAR
ncbi:MAG TPA: PorP/SprF family type IX secretion system membrane protein, partial [Agitococcus sp.]|nr:PorP/SprF family type IX secretion system membrane protein [Agitococcus sp.]